MDDIYKRNFILFKWMIYFCCMIDVFLCADLFVV